MRSTYKYGINKTKSTLLYHRQQIGSSHHLWLWKKIREWRLWWDDSKQIHWAVWHSHALHPELCMWCSVPFHTRGHQHPGMVCRDRGRSIWWWPLSPKWPSPGWSDIGTEISSAGKVVSVACLLDPLWALNRWRIEAGLINVIWTPGYIPWDIAQAGGHHPNHSGYLEVIRWE